MTCIHYRFQAAIGNRLQSSLLPLMTYFSWSFEPLAVLLATNLFSRPTCIMTITGTSSLNCRVFFLQDKELIKKKKIISLKKCSLANLVIFWSMRQKSNSIWKHSSWLECGVYIWLCSLRVQASIVIKMTVFHSGDWHLTTWDDKFPLGCENLSHHYRQQSFTGLFSPGWSDYTVTAFEIEVFFDIDFECSWCSKFDLFYQVVHVKLMYDKENSRMRG